MYGEGGLFTGGGFCCQSFGKSEFEDECGRDGCVGNVINTPQQ